MRIDAAEDVGGGLGGFFHRDPSRESAFGFQHGFANVECAIHVVDQLFDAGESGIVKWRGVECFCGLYLLESGFELCDVHGKVLTAGLHGIKTALIGPQNFALGGEDLMIPLHRRLSSLQGFKPLCEVRLHFRGSRKRRGR